jgi:hypothetical protein
LIRTDITQIPVLAHQAADIRVISLNFSVLRRRIAVGASPGNGFCYSVAASPLVFYISKVFVIRMERIYETYWTSKIQITVQQRDFDAVVE